MSQKKNDSQTSLAILPIGAIARALQVHPRTLRIYDEEGILRPERTEKNRRNYSLDDLEKAKTITFLTRNLALNLAAVKIIYAILNESKIDPKDYLDYIKDIAKKANIGEEAQEENYKRTSSRGRKPKAK